MRRVVVAALAALLALAAPASAGINDPGGNYTAPAATGVVNCVYFSAPLAALQSSGLWSIGCDANGNLRVTSAATSAGAAIANPAFQRIEDGGSTNLAIVNTTPGFDGITGFSNSLLVANFNFGYNGTQWDRLRSVPGAAVLEVSSGGSHNANVAAAATAAAVKTGAGRLASILVVTAGTAALTVTDGSGGTTIAIVPANATAGTEIKVDRSFATSAFVNSGAGTPQVTVSYD